MTAQQTAATLTAGQARVIEEQVEAVVRQAAGVADCAVVCQGVDPTDGVRRRCVRCGTNDRFPRISFDADGTCSLCTMYIEHATEIDTYWQDFELLAPKLRAAAEAVDAPYDCLLLFSGGKDSTYVLYRLVEMGLRVMTFTFDNGFISRTALRNVDDVTGELGIEHITATRADQNKIFLQSLQEHKSVCNGCFRSLLELSTKLAHERGIPTIVTGLSRGQIMDERLSWFHQQGIFDVEEIEEKLAIGRQVYHSSSLTVDAGSVRSVDVVDFYRYSEVTKDGIRALLKSRSKLWSQPTDTGFCSSNCLINDVGVYVHSAERGFHNYEAPTRWEVRLGHLDRAEADEELQPPVATAKVKTMMARIGYPDPAEARIGSRLTVYYVPVSGTDIELGRAAVTQLLPEGLAPETWVEVPEIPVVAGAVDRAALVAPKSSRFAVDEPAGLTPVQEAAYRRGGARALLLDADGSLSPARAKQLVLGLLMRHDALRLRVTEVNGQARPETGGLGGTVPVARLDLSTKDSADHSLLLRTAAARLRELIDPATGPLLRAAVIDRGAGPGGLLLVVHELAADTASWRTLLADLAGEPVTAPAGADVPDATAVLIALAAELGGDPLLVEFTDHTAAGDTTTVGRRVGSRTVAVSGDTVTDAVGPATVAYDHFGDLAALLPTGGGWTVSNVVDFTDIGVASSASSVAGVATDGRFELRRRNGVSVVDGGIADRVA